MSARDGARGAVDGIERSWSTEGLPEHEQLPFWREVVRDAFVPVSVESARPGMFSGSVIARPVGPLGISRIASGGQAVTRTGEQTSQRAGDTFFLNLPLTPGTSATQDGRTAILDPGDFAIVDSARPFELSFTGEFSQVSIALPHDLLAPRLQASGSATAVTVSGSRGLGAVASGAVRALAQHPEPVDRQAGRSLAEHLAGLIALALGGVAQAPRSSRALLTQAALDEIERSLTDPQLTPARVAERISISTRYLHALFADRGVSFGRWLQQRRLERGRAVLCDPRSAHRSVAEIALDHGFRDPSHFTRAFRARFGETPRQARRRSFSPD
jgi:AraC family transcriptional regulator, positive regulator of tynA and feaB